MVGNISKEFYCRCTKYSTRKTKSGQHQMMSAYHIIRGWKYLDQRSTTTAARSTPSSTKKRKSGQHQIMPAYYTWSENISFRTKEYYYSTAATLSTSRRRGRPVPVNSIKPCLSITPYIRVRKCPQHAVENISTRDMAGSDAAQPFPAPPLFRL